METLELNKLLTEENLSEMKNLLQIEFLKRGITAPIKYLEETSSGARNENEIHFKTENFQTTPIIFKELNICDSYSSIKQIFPTEGEKYIEVYINCKYNYKYFSCGENGASIFDIIFRVHKRDVVVHFIK